MSRTKFNWLDRAIAYAFPGWAASRLYYRDALASFRGGVENRTSRAWSSPRRSEVGGTMTEQNRIREMRARARQLEQDNPLASGLLDRATENVIGAGIDMRAATDSPEFNAQIDNLFARWRRVCDIRGELAFGGMQRILYRQKLRDGDVGVVLVDRGGEPRLQIIEADRIDYPTKRGTKNIIDGVEIDAIGRAVRYYVLAGDPWKTEPIPIQANNFRLIKRLRYSNHIRGLTAFSQGFPLFDHIDGYVEGSVIAARAAANQALLIKRTNASQAYSKLSASLNGNGMSQAIQRMEPGMVHYLNPDEDVVQMNPAHPTQSFPDFVAALARFVGLNFGLTLEQVMLDFSRTNYSSARAARLQADQTAYVEQQEFYDSFLFPVWRWLVSKWVKSGLVTGRVPEDYWAHEWIPQGKAWVDPTKEISAAALAIDYGLESRTNIALGIGYRFEDLVKRNAEDRRMMDAADLPLVNSTLTRHPQLGVGAQGDPLGVERVEPKQAAPADDETETTEDEDAEAT
jgi:lambda family phage portal protein